MYGMISLARNSVAKWKGGTLAAALLLTLAACGGSSSDSPAPPPPEEDGGSAPAPAPDPYQISIADGAAQEGDLTVAVAVSLDRTADEVVTVQLTSSDDSALNGADYSAVDELLTITIGSDSTTIDIPILDDSVEETDETFRLTLSNPSTNATIADGTASVSIADDDGPAPPAASANIVNDTGITGCVADTGVDLDCANAAAGTDLFPQQDGEFGIDLTEPGDADGRAGFQFTKLDMNGQPLADQSVDYATNPWRCVRDERTGLLWEVKADDTGAQSGSWTYYYDLEATYANRGIPPKTGGGVCDTDDCAASSLLETVKNENVCGQSDWRIPSRRELLSILNLGVSPPLIDSNFFPNTAPVLYWSADSDLIGQVFVDLATAESLGDSSLEAAGLRLVSGGRYL